MLSCVCRSCKGGGILIKITVESDGKTPLTLVCDACVLFTYRDGAASNLIADGESLDMIEDALEHAEQAIGEYTGTYSSSSPPS